MRAAEKLGDIAKREWAWVGSCAMISWAEKASLTSEACRQCDKEPQVG
jgi:hypothetical protein